MAYRNVTEEIVLMNVDKVLSDIGCCNCESCRTDVITYALNRLPPRYVSSSKGELISEIEAHIYQNATDIIFTLTEGAVLVKANPKHK